MNVLYQLQDRRSAMLPSIGTVPLAEIEEKEEDGKS